MSDNNSVQMEIVATWRTMINTTERVRTII